jgi:signal transduction histidine kinase
MKPGSLDTWRANTLAAMVLRQMPAGLVICDRHGKIVLANELARHLAQINVEQNGPAFSPHIWGELFTLEGHPISVNAWPSIRALFGETTIAQECRLRRSNGGFFDILFSAGPITAHKQIVGAISVLTDITREKRLEKMVRKRAVYRERRQFAGHIHDTISQGLSALALQLQLFEDESSPGEAQGRLRDARGQVLECLNQARKLMWTLSAESLESEELSSALLIVAKQLFTTTPVNVEVALQQEPRRLSSKVRDGLLRIGKEALTNVQKHASATTVHIELAYKRRKVQLTIADNGRGFTSGDSAISQGGFGLLGMRKRAENLGGTFLVETCLGSGTRIVAVVPLISRN